VALEWLEHIIHQGLECCQGISQAERHHQELKVAMVHPKHRLLDIGEVNMNLGVSRTQVKLGEESGTVKSVKELVNDGDSEFVLHGASVEGLVVDAESPGAIMLLDKQDGRGEVEVL
jgi:hypothetical protein